MTQHVLVLGVDGWSRHDEDADHLAHVVREVVRHRLGDEAAARAVVATHDVRTGVPHAAVSCLVPDTTATPSDDGGLAEQVRGLVEALAGVLPASGAVAATSARMLDGVSHGTDPGSLTGAWVAVAAAATGTSGRLVHFGGAEALTGRLSVDDVLAGSAVDEVVVVGGSPHTGDTVVDTRGFVRPTLERGRVRLLVQPAAGGVVVPFERENPHRCCGDH